MPEPQAAFARKGVRAGQGLVEYALIICLVIIAAIGAVTLFGGEVANLFTRIRAAF